MADQDSRSNHKSNNHYPTRTYQYNTNNSYYGNENSENGKCNKVSENNTSGAAVTNGSNNKNYGDDCDNVEETPLDIGEHYLVKRIDGWREF